MLPASIAIPLALTAFVAAAVVCFGRLGSPRATVAMLLGGTLLIPVFEAGPVHVPLLATKAMFVPAVVLAVSLLLDGPRWRRLHVTWMDAPLAVLCAAPFVSSLANHLGLYDACYAGLGAAMTWGAPYLLGRVYLGDPVATRVFANGLVVAAIAYAPLCLWEVRMSPQLHVQAYGFPPFGQSVTWGQSIRFGGYRPSVFMSHGLMLGMFMASATLVALWLWRTRGLRSLWRVPFGWWCALLTATTLLTKSVGAILLLAGGVAVLELTRRVRTSVLLVALLVVPAVYCSARITGAWSGQTLVTLSAETINVERSGSLAFRLANEDMLIARALERPWFGWGGWGRSHVHDEGGRDLSVTDGLWIIVLGANGAVGLVALGLLLALPTAALLWRFPARHWSDPRLAPAAAVAVSCLLWAIDGLFNAMVTPIFPAACGGITSLVLAVARRRSRPPGRTNRTARPLAS